MKHSPGDRTLIALAPEMREMLLRLEWGGDYRLGEGFCFVCKRYQHEQHHPQCHLATLLDKIR